MRDRAGRQERQNGCLRSVAARRSTDPRDTYQGGIRDTTLKLKRIVVRAYPLAFLTERQKTIDRAEFAMKA